MGAKNQAYHQEFKKFLQKMDLRLSKNCIEPLLNESLKDGFESPCEWVYFSIKTERETITTLNKKTNVKKRTLAAIIQRILETEDDEELIETSLEWRQKASERLCTRCGKEKVTGYFFCRDCQYKARKIAGFIDLDMMGDY